jgi:hypothetical protein
MNQELSTIMKLALIKISMKSKNLIVKLTKFLLKEIKYLLFVNNKLMFLGLFEELKLYKVTVVILIRLSPYTRLKRID